MIVEKILVDEIKAGDRFSKPDKAQIDSMAESMKEDGLLEPIGINKDNTLIYGLTRLLAAQELGWKTIHCVILDYDAITARKLELTENLKRRVFSALEECEALAELKNIYQELHPHTRRGGDRRSDDFSKVHNAPLKTALAKETGLIESNVKRKIATAKAIDPKAADAIRETDVADSQAELKRLGKLAPRDQVKVAKAIQEGKADTVTEATKLVSCPFDLDDGPEIPTILDGKKQEVPDVNNLREIFSLRPRFMALQKKLAECRTEWIDLCQSAAGRFCDIAGKTHLQNAHHAVEFATPYLPCNCQGHGCNRCKKTHYVTKSVSDVDRKKKS